MGCHIIVPQNISNPRVYTGDIYHRRFHTSKINVLNFIITCNAPIDIESGFCFVYGFYIIFAV